MINLARNLPIAIVFGAAGFLGSHVIQKLLSKGVQVIGVDNLSTGFKENLLIATKDKFFHFVYTSGGVYLDLSLPRLDYVVFSIDDKIQEFDYLSYFKTFLQFCLNVKQKNLCKVVLLSSVRMYDPKQAEEDHLREVEGLLAKFAIDKKINARIVRLVPVFGPRMHFREDDPIVDLILAAIRGDIHQQMVSLDFTTRAIYIDDAVELILKALFSGGTARKIYDGAAYHPIKISEIKQVLLDPIWHEVKRFVPTELPPWPTPNLEKTQKELSWEAKTSIVTCLKHTLTFFRENPDRIPKEEVATVIKVPKEKIDPVSSKTPSEFNLKPIRSYLTFLVGILLITYVLVYPSVALMFGSLSIRYHLKKSNQALNLGDFEQADKEIKFVSGAIEDMKEVFTSTDFIRALGLFKSHFKLADILLDILEKVVAGSTQLGGATKNLYQALGSATGEREGQAKYLLPEAQVNLAAADVNFSESLAKLSDQNLMSLLPGQIKDRVDDLKDKLSLFQKNTSSVRLVNLILTDLVGDYSPKTYLIILNNNHQLTGGGGKIISWANVGFEGGKLINIKVGDQLNARELNNLNNEPDFLTNAQELYLRYRQLTNVELAGILAIDLTAMESLIDAIGGIDPGDGIRLNGQSFKMKILETNDQEVINQLTLRFLSKILFVAKTDLPQVAMSLDKAFGQKHASVYFTKKDMLTAVTSAGWSATFPRGVKDKSGSRVEFLSLNETNLSPKSALIKARLINLTLTLSESGVLSNKLTIDYVNGDRNLKFNLRVYLTSGSKLDMVNFSSIDKLAGVKSFFDYGRSGYSIDLELKEDEQKQLIMEYSSIRPVEFASGAVKLKLDVVKQIGSLADRLEYKLTVPEGVTIKGSEGSVVNFSSDLSTDRSFEVILIKRK